MAKEKAKKKTQAKKKISKKKEAKKKPIAAKEEIIKAPVAGPERAEASRRAEEPKIVPEQRVEEVKEAAIPEQEKKEAPKQKAAPGALYSATGRRKTAIARVKLVPGSGNILINSRPLLQYVAGRRVLEVMIKEPLKTTETADRYDVDVKVIGGGVASQAGAVAHGIARALLDASPDFRAKIKPKGFLSRDPRMKERKKYGRKKARKRFQYSKR
jgi:small subunit ribosomal protein S9